MHIRELNGLRIPQLLELAMVFGVPVPLNECQDERAIKSRIATFFNDMPQLYQGNFVQLDRYMGQLK